MCSMEQGARPDPPASPLVPCHPVESAAGASVMDNVHSSILKIAILKILNILISRLSGKLCCLWWRVCKGSGYV